MEEEFFCCNFKRCKVILKNKAWVTYCYHIFCSEHFSSCKPDRCPLCVSEFKSDGDLVEVNLNPSNEERSMSLLGLSPSNILRVSTRALSFWMFQMFQDKLYLTSLVKHFRCRLAQSETFHKNEEEKLNNLIQQERLKFNALQRDMNDSIKNTQNLEKKIDAKNRQLFSFRKQIEALKRQENGTSRSNRIDHKYEPRQTNIYRTKVSPNIMSQKQTIDVDSDNIIYYGSQQQPYVPRSNFRFHPNF